VKLSSYTQIANSRIRLELKAKEERLFEEKNNPMFLESISKT
jgi:hypothetical protein